MATQETAAATAATNEKAPEATKVVIRHLPPLLKEEAFLSMLHKLCQEHLEWFWYQQGKVSPKGKKSSLAFVKLSRPELVPLLKWALEQRPFMDEKGVAYQCQVELAPFQKVPRKNRKKDPREGTYEQDLYFTEFTERLAQEEAAANEAPIITAQSTLSLPEETAPVVTALMQHLIDKHSSKGKGSRPPQNPRPAAAGSALSGGRSAAPPVASTSKGEAMSRDDMLASAAAAVQAAMGKAASRPAAAATPPPSRNARNSAPRPESAAASAGKQSRPSERLDQSEARPGEPHDAASQRSESAADAESRPRPRINVGSRMFGGVVLDALARAGLQAPKREQPPVAAGAAESQPPAKGAAAAAAAAATGGKGALEGKRQADGTKENRRRGGGEKGRGSARS